MGRDARMPKPNWNEEYVALSRWLTSALDEIEELRNIAEELAQVYRPARIRALAFQDALDILLHEEMTE